MKKYAKISDNEMNIAFHFLEQEHQRSALISEIIASRCEMYNLNECRKEWWHEKKRGYASYFSIMKGTGK